MMSYNIGVGSIAAAGAKNPYRDECQGAPVQQESEITSAMQRLISEQQNQEELLQELHMRLKSVLSGEPPPSPDTGKTERQSCSCELTDIILCRVSTAIRHNDAIRSMISRLRL